MLGFGNRRKGRFAGGYFAPPESPSLAHSKERVQRLVILLAFVLLVASITKLPTLGIRTSVRDIDSETIASQTIRAEFAFEAIDLDATREKEDREAIGVPQTYTVDVGRVDNQLENLAQRFLTLQSLQAEADEAIREALLSSDSRQTREQIVAQAVTKFAQTLKEDPLYESWPDASILAVALAPKSDTVPKRAFASEVIRIEAPGTGGETTTLEYQKVASLTEPESEEFEALNLEAMRKLAEEGLKYVLTFGVIQSNKVTMSEGESPPRVQIIRGNLKLVGDLRPAYEDVLTAIPDPVKAKIELNKYIAESARKLQEEDVEKAIEWDLVQNAAFEMAKSSVTDTLFEDDVVTAANRSMARANVEPSMRRFEANEIIQDDGRPWTDQSRSDVKTYWAQQTTGRQAARSLISPIIANMIFASLLLLALLRAMPVLAKSKTDIYKSINVMLLVICATLVLGRVMSYFEASGLVVPVTAGAILLTILTNARVASFASVIAVILLSIQYGHKWELLAVHGAMCFTGISSLYAVRRRGDIAGAAIKATLIGLVTIFAVSLGKGALIEWQTLYSLAKIGLSGSICLFVVPGLLSPLERMFRITTDIQLLEYSDLNNDLLRRLAIEIPATWAHSLALGQLAEATADAIGANGLLARVCAYYHDIGKLKRPEYFGENQTGQNIHDELSPRLSARAIASHVSEGAEMAREHHLPKPIIDGILEHHGSLLISFFYQQALEQQKHGDTREEDFRYPGPKPRSSETAILMICDAVESGVRTIKNPNEERVCEFVDRIIQQRSEDRQFDECELTLKKLDIIGDVLSKQILTMLHTRVAYPERLPAERAANVIHISGNRD